MRGISFGRVASDAICLTGDKSRNAPEKGGKAGFKRLIARVLNRKIIIVAPAFFFQRKTIKRKSFLTAGMRPVRQKKGRAGERKIHAFVDLLFAEDKADCIAVLRRQPAAVPCGKAAVIDDHFFIGKIFAPDATDMSPRLKPVRQAGKVQSAVAGKYRHVKLPVIGLSLESGILQRIPAALFHMRKRFIR